MRELKARPGVLLAAAVGSLPCSARSSSFSWVGSAVGRTSSSPPAEPAAEIEADVVVAPREVLFGDTVEARFEIVLDKERVDPESVRSRGRLLPVGDRREVGDPSPGRRRRRVSPDDLRAQVRLGHVRSRPGQSARYDFRPARIAFGAPRDQRIEESSIELPLPPIRVYSRFAAANRDADPFSSPWRADVLTLPAVSYGVAPACPARRAPRRRGARGVRRTCTCVRRLAAPRCRPRPPSRRHRRPFPS